MALELFDAKGFEGSTVREIAKASGVTPGAIYNHFASKHDILNSIVRKLLEDLDNELDSAATSVGPRASDQLEAVVGALVLRYARSNKAARIINRESEFLLPQARAEVDAQRQQILRLISTLLKSAQRSGPIRSGKLTKARPSSELDTDVAATALLDMCAGVAAWRRPDRRMPPIWLSKVYGELAVRILTSQR